MGKSSRFVMGFFLEPSSFVEALLDDFGGDLDFKSFGVAGTTCAACTATSVSIKAAGRLGSASISAGRAEEGATSSNATPLEGPLGMYNLTIVSMWINSGYPLSDKQQQNLQIASDRQRQISEDVSDKQRQSSIKNSNKQIQISEHASKQLQISLNQ